MKLMIAVLLFFISLGAFCCNQRNQDSKQAAQAHIEKASNITQDTYGKGYPRIEFEHDSYDFGTVEEGQRTKHVYTFKNVGTQELGIKKIKTSCACNAVFLSGKNPVPPGETRSLEVEFDSKGHKGPVFGIVTLVSNDPKEPRKNISFKAIVKVPLWVSPPDIHFGRVIRGTRPVKRISLFGNSHDLDAVSITPSSDLIVVNRVENDRNGEACLLDVTLMPGLPVGYVNQSIVFTLKTKKKYTIEVAVRAEIVGEIEAVPRIVNFGIVKPNQLLSRTINLHLHSSQEAHKVKVNGSKNLIVKMDSTKRKENYKITVTLKAGSSNGMMKERVSVHFGDTAMPIIEVPVYALVRKPTP